jgi:hypothetical protein
MVRFETYTAVTMMNTVFWDMMPCGSCKNRRFGGTYRLHHKDGKNQRAKNVSSVLQLLVAAYVVPTSLILSTRMMETIRTSETWVLTKATRRHIPEDAFLYRLLLVLALNIFKLCETGNKSPPHTHTHNYNCSSVTSFAR